MKKTKSLYCQLLLLGIVYGAAAQTVMTVNGPLDAQQTGTWLHHEHILVDFIGADSTGPHRWNRDSVTAMMLPALKTAKAAGVVTFVDATPNFLGRDVGILQTLSEKSGMQIITNTGLYGYNYKHLPAYTREETAEELAQRWIAEFENGIDGTEVKPGFIKISVNASDPLEPMDAKLVKAAALTHLKTGLVILCHTGPALGVYPQLRILKEVGVSPEAFVWVHAQQEENMEEYLKLARTGIWIALDGVPWAYEAHLEKLLFARESGILDQILISHDGGWYEAGKSEQTLQPFTTITNQLVPDLQKAGFSDEEVMQLLQENPKSAFALQVRKY